MTAQTADPRSSLRGPAVAGVFKSAIAELARDLQVSETEVLDAYESEFKRFGDARIQMFVPVLVEKRVRRKLRGLH